MKKLFGRQTAALIILLPALITMTASRAYALQSHGDAEGLLSHQLGHFLFFSGMLFLLWHIHKAHLTTSGWRDFKLFLLLILLWNILTFTGHWLRIATEPEQFIRHAGRVTAFRIETSPDLLFYITRLDHLLLVPAVFFLLQAICKWGKDQ